MDKIEIIYEGGDDIKVQGTKDAWYDLALLIEALGVCAAAAIGKNPRGLDTPAKMNAYIKEYIDKIKYAYVVDLAGGSMDV